MKTNWITLLLSSAVLVTALWGRRFFFTEASSHIRYYGTAMLMISGILTIVTLYRLVRQQLTGTMEAGSSGQKTSGQSRRHYRIRFDTPPYPVFIQKTGARRPAPEFTCPVRDVSETGIGLECTGVYAKGLPVQGEIIFDSGRTAPVNGIVIRQEADRTCLRLHCTIDPGLLMAEQRERIVIKKSSGPRPAVSKTLLDDTAGSLPSYSPKGICRLKRR